MKSEEGLPVGVRPAPGKRRKQPDAKRVHARIAAFLDEVSMPRKREGLVGRREVVTPLNPGFFLLEQMRAQRSAKKRNMRRVKVRGK